MDAFVCTAHMRVLVTFFWHKAVLYLTCFSAVEVCIMQLDKMFFPRIIHWKAAQGVEQLVMKCIITLAVRVSHSIDQQSMTPSARDDHTATMIR
jgi:hypothetical protein